MQNEMYYVMAYFIIDEFPSGDSDDSIDESVYSSIYLKFESHYFTPTYKEKLKQSFGEGLEHVYYSTAQNVSLTQFVDIVYEKYNIEEMFRSCFQEIYHHSYELLLFFGSRLVEELDFADMVTQYLR